MSGLRFAMLTTFYPPYNFGGDGIAVRRLSRALVRRGHHVTVLHDADAWRILAGSSDPPPEDEPDGLEVVTIESGLGPVSPLLTHQTGRPLATGGKISSVLEQGDFDVVHFNNVSLIGGPGLLSAGDGLKVYEAHEHWLVCPTHVLWRHDREPCTGRECLRCVLHYRRPPQLWRYTGYLERQLDHVDLFIAKSEFSRRKHHEFGFSRQMEVLPYFLPEGSGDGTPETRPSSPPEEGSPWHRPYFLFVGRLERIKGLQDVIPVFADYERADLLVAGDGDFGATLRRQAEDVPSVEFLGRVPPDRLRPLYENALALVVPSVGFETFGIVLIEAFQHGTPVIARDIGPFPEIVEGSGGGMLFEDRDQLRAALGRIQADPDLRDRLSASARRAARKRWTEEAVVPRYLDLISREAARRNMAKIPTRLGDRRATAREAES